MGYNFALAGNPNVGKTSLYNRITHSFEHVGNWHGVTVKEISKEILYNHERIKITDLPGLYSLTVYSFEEGIARDGVVFGKNDIVISICEVNNLSRNLYLTLQLLELDLPVVLAVNMMDELKKQGKVLNYRKLEEILRLPVIPMSAKYHSDVHLLMDTCLDHIKRFKTNPVALTYLSKLPIQEVLNLAGSNIEAAGLKPTYAAIKVLENDTFVLEKLRLSDSQKAGLAKLGDWQAAVAQARYEYIDEISEGIISKAVGDEHGEMLEHEKFNVPIESGSKNILIRNGKQDRHIERHNLHKLHAQPYMQKVSRIDRIVLNKYLALPIFLLIMAAIFVLTFGLFGKWMSDGLEFLIERFLYTPFTKWMVRIDAPPVVSGLIGEGIIKGLGGILVFLPQIVLLFFFLALLEDSGYIARVAFMTDGLFRKIGLSGRSVFTMLMGFGCSATAVLTSRGLEDVNMRRKTVLLTPFMSCSARLPVYATIASAFFFGGAPFIIFGLYLSGVAVSMLLAIIFEKMGKRLKSGKLSFIMEMPPYRFPTFERIIQLIWNNAKVFIIRVGTVVFALNVLVWLLSNFSIAGYILPDDKVTRSFMEIFCGWIEPVFRPLGFGNWRAITSLMTGLVAKEGVLTSIESLGGVETIFAGDGLAAFTFLVFTLLYVPCIATLSAISKELNWKWALFSFGLQMGVAYIVSLAVHSIGLLFRAHVGWAVGILLLVAVGIALILVCLYLFRRRGKCIGCSRCSGQPSCEKRAGEDCGKNVKMTGKREAARLLPADNKPAGNAKQSEKGQGDAAASSSGHKHKP